MREDASRDPAPLSVPLAGAVVATGDPWRPYQVLDGVGRPVVAVSDFLDELQAAGRAATTLRSYAMDLLRWFRFLWAIGVDWNRAGRVDARDFARWMQVAGKPQRPHWRTPDAPVAREARPVPYSPSARAHSETVLRSFYGFHLEAGTGPLINPFPLERSRRGGRAHAHHNPMEPYRNERSGLFRPRLASRIPRSIPDEKFNEIFACLDRGPGLGVAVGSAQRRRSRQAGDHGDP